jgi:prepilin-type N-terminal cleavage/methylation domain-containing protein
MIKSLQLSRGFTLVEIVLVITIIGIFSTVAMSSFSDARAQARDKVRLASLQQLQLALELYKDKNGVYPDEGCGDNDTWTGPGPHPSAWGNDADCPEYIVGLAPTYINELPRDPSAEMVDDRGFIYQVSGDNRTYKVLVHRSVESLFITSFNDDYARCPTAVGACIGGIAGERNIYAIYSAGAEGW